MPVARPIPIALCITDLDVGGAERCLVELACRLDRRRFAPRVYSLAPRPVDHPAGLVGRLEAADIPTQFLGVTSAWQLLHARKRLAALLREQQPQVLQCFLFHANIVGRLAARKAGVGKVVSGIRVAERGARWHLWLDRLTQRHVAKHVCVSQAVARFSQTEGRLPPEKMTVIPNGIDLGRYPAPNQADLQALGAPIGAHVAISIGRLEPQKGLDWLLSEASGWLTTSESAHWVVVGRGPQLSALQQLAASRGLDGRVHFAGWRPDVPELLAAAQLLLLPSRWEGMPNVVLEAMATGLPVVASDVEGVRELLGPGSDMQTAAAGDAQTFSRKAFTLLSNPQLAAEIGTANRCRAEECFGLERMAEAYQSLWESLTDH